MSEQLIAAVSDHFVFLVIASAIVAAMLVNAVRSAIFTVTRERTRREIAAYIAEGTMTPEQGERLMKAGRNC